MTKKRNYKLKTTTETDYGKLLKISIIVLGIFLLVYLITAILSGEIKLTKDKEKEIAPSEIQYNEIIGGTVFNRVDSEYYVLFYSEKYTKSSYLFQYVNSYRSQKNNLTLYTVNLDEKINANYYSEDSVNTNSIDTLKVKNPTLIKVKDKKAIETIIRYDEILKIIK